MVWTYLAKYKILPGAEILYQNLLTLEQVDIPYDKSDNEFNDFTNGYKDLLKDGFFDGFSDHNVLFVSKYEPHQSPMTRDKMFVLNFDNKKN